jgi:hypothetical protein
VPLDGLDGHEQLVCDLAVGSTLGGQLGDTTLAGGQLVDQLLGGDAVP